jgi:hypothetical protein
MARCHIYHFNKMLSCTHQRFALKANCIESVQIVLLHWIDLDGSKLKFGCNCRKERNFKVVIKFAARADLHHLGQFLAGRQADAPQEALQVLDIVLRELPTHR